MQRIKKLWGCSGCYFYGNYFICENFHSPKLRIYLTKVFFHNPVQTLPTATVIGRLSGGRVPRPLHTAKGIHKQVTLYENNSENSEA